MEKENFAQQFSPVEYTLHQTRFMPIVVCKLRLKYTIVPTKL